MQILIIFIFGMILGAVGWFISPILTGTFEPFDSSLAMSIGQLVMSAYGAYSGFRSGFVPMLMAVFGLYVGQIGYWYLFGSDEARAWVLLGVFATLLLCVLPLLAGVSGVVIQRMLRPQK